MLVVVLFLLGLSIADSLSSPSQFTVTMLFLITAALFSLPFLTHGAPLAKRAYPPVGACSGDCGAVHDPNVVISADGTYYRFITFNKITIATAPSISGPWTSQGAAIPAGSVIDLPGNQDLWAPDVRSLFLFLLSPHPLPSDNASLPGGTSH